MTSYIKKEKTSTSLKLICPVSFNISLRASISVNMRPIKSPIEADWS